MRPIYPLLATFIAVAASCTCNPPPKPEKAENLDKIEPKDEEKASGQADSGLGALPKGAIGSVGDVEISGDTFRKLYQLKVSKYVDRGRDIPRSADRRYRRSLSERLIYQEVLRQEVKALGIAVDEAAVEAQLQEQKQNSRDWDKQLARRGETEASLRENYWADHAEEAILEHLGRLEVTQADIDQDYARIKDNWTADKPRVRASHILVPVGPDGGRRSRRKKDDEPEPSAEEKAQWEAEAKAKADELYAKATAEGADFAAIAREHSTGPSAKKGGDLGIFTPDRMAEEFSEVAFKLEPGQISKPVKTKFGYHIIKVEGHWPPGPLPEEALHEQIVRRLAQRKLHKGRKDLKEELIEKYDTKNVVVDAMGPPPKPERRRLPKLPPMQNPHAKNPHGMNPHGAKPPAEAPADDVDEPEEDPDAESPDPDDPED